MSELKPASSRGPEICKPPPFPVSRYVREYEYAFYLDASRFTDRRTSNRALTICDGLNVLRDTHILGLGQMLLALWWTWHLFAAFGRFQN